MKIVVMCETLLQFNEYVNAVLHDESLLTIKRTVRRNGSGVIVHTDDLEFIYCKHPDTLRGRTFSKDDHIMRVGAWYNIPVDVQEDIIAYFMLRMQDES